MQRLSARREAFAADGPADDPVPPRSPQPAPPAAEAQGRAPPGVPVEPTELPPLRAIVGFALMAIGMFMAVLDIQIVAASLSQIQAGLSASPDEISWVQTSYLVAEVIMIPLSGYLMRALGTRNLFVSSAAGFVVTSFLCATATTLNEMILYRALQGFIGGAMIPTAFASSFSLFPRRYKTQVTVAISLLLTLAPTVGPTLGGVLTDALSWHWIFLVNVPPGLLCVFGVLTLMDRGARDLRLLSKIDGLALLLMAVGLGGLDYVLEEGARSNWLDDPMIVRIGALSIVSGVLFLWRNSLRADPLVNLEPYGNRNYGAASILQLMVGVGMFGVTFAYPVFLGRIAGLSSAQIGETLFVTGLTMMIFAPVAGQIARRVDLRRICATGFLLLAASAWTSEGMTADWRFWELFLPQVLRGLGLMCLMVSTSVIAFATLPPRLLGQASALFVLMRNIGGAMGLGLINTMLIERGALHWNRLVGSLDAGRADIIERMEGMRQLAEARGLDPDQLPLRLLARQVEQQATVLSFIDLFHILTFGFLAMAVLPLLLKRPPGFEDAPADAH